MRSVICARAHTHNTHSLLTAGNIFSNNELPIEKTNQSNTEKETRFKDQTQRRVLETETVKKTINLKRKNEVKIEGNNY